MGDTPNEFLIPLPPFTLHLSMKPCDLHTGESRIRRSLDDLHRVWADASDEWDDAASRAFADERLEPIAPVVRAALDAVARMQRLLDQATRDVEG